MNTVFSNEISIIHKAYLKYVEKWYKDHDEGAPAGFGEFIDNEVFQLAKDLDDFAFEYDFYSYKESVDDRTEHIDLIMSQLQAGKTNIFIECLTDVIDEDEEPYSSEAKILIERILELGGEHENE